MREAKEARLKTQKNTMEKNKTFFRKCPVKGCRAMSGFYLSDQDIKENEKYYCQDCSIESKLSKWEKIEDD